MGSSLLGEVFCDITDNFDDENPEDNAILERLFETERSMREAGILTNDHVFGTYRPK